MHINFSKTRERSVFLIILVIFVLLSGRLLYIQILSNKRFSELAAKQHNIFIRIAPRRGNIFDSHGRAMALYVDRPSIYMVPREIENKKGTASILADKFSVDEDTMLSRLQRDNYFGWVRRKAPPGTEDEVKKLGIQGIYTIPEPKRSYPGGGMACHVLGITSVDNKGLEGVELYYDNDLRGEYGWRRSARDAKRRELISFERETLEARDGNNLILTIDQVIQHVVEKEIDNISEKYKPVSASIVVLRPGTGEVLAMASIPRFDPNDISDAAADKIRNRALTDSFEPGSVFKIVAASGALEEGVVNFDTKFFCENGTWRVGKRTLHDYHAYGILTFREVIEKSSNIGVAKAADKLGKEKFYSYIKKFNFGKPTGIDLPGEIGGISREASRWAYSDMTTIPMGQGIAVTSMQLALLTATIANNGVMMKPYVVSRIETESGALVEEVRPKAIGRVISEETAEKVKELMEGVLERGTGKSARLKAYRAGGKTGTAQKVNPAGGYYDKKYIASFIGFAPYKKPEIAMAVSVDDPKGRYFGGQVCAPAFKEIAEKILPYLEIESDRDENKKTP